MKEIRHKLYGVGKVLYERYGGAELFVQFQGGFRKWVKSIEIDASGTKLHDSNDVKASDESDIAYGNQSLKSTHKSKSLKLQAFDSEKFSSRANIEALRMGLFPERNIEDFTFGRNKETDFVKKWLKNPSNGSLIITGEYGVGKTHFLEYLKRNLLKDNWAVSFLEFDSNSAPLNKPKILYEMMIKSFEYKGGNFKDFLHELASSPNSYVMKDHQHLYEMIRRIQRGTDREYIWNWIHGVLEHAGTQTRLPPIYSYSTASNVFSYILSGIGYAAKEALGLNGFLILFDEAENIDPYWYSTYQREKGWNFLEGLILMTNNSEELQKDLPFKEIFISNRKSPELRGRITDLQYYNNFSVPYIWQIPCSCKMIFAFTPYEFLLNTYPLKNLEKFHLNHLDFEAKQEIATEVSLYYYKAYNFIADEERGELLSDFPDKFNSTRIYIKSLVELLDLLRFHPDKPLKELIY